MNRVEINLDWADIEPQDGAYDFRLLNRYMAEAAKAHLKIYLLFWESVWGEKLREESSPMDYGPRSFQRWRQSFGTPVVGSGLAQGIS